MHKIEIQSIEVEESLISSLKNSENEELRVQDFVDFFNKNFGVKPDLMSTAGGRVNLIGEHVDYPDVQFCEGNRAELYSLGSAIQNNFLAALSERDDENLHLVHLNAKQSFIIPISELSNLESQCVSERENKIPFKDRQLPEWLPHTLGTIFNAIGQSNATKGFNLLMTSNVPFGAGLSASAANCSALTLVLNEFYNLGLKENIEIVTFARASENSKFAGGHCGWLDYQLIIQSKENLLTQICYADNSIEYFSSNLPASMQFITINTNVPHVLAESDYVIRVAELDAAINFLSTFFGEQVNGPKLGLAFINQAIQMFDNNAIDQIEEGIKKLVLEYSDNKCIHLKSKLKDLPAYVEVHYEVLDYKNHGSLSKQESFVILLKRLRHQSVSSVLVPLAGEAAKKGDSQSFGELLNQEGVSLRMSGDFEITGDNGAQDQLLDIGFKTSKEVGLNVFGRMLGGGGGGNVLFYADRNDESKYQEWKEKVCLKYNEWSSLNFADKPIATCIEPLVSAGANLIKH